MPRAEWLQERKERGETLAQLAADIAENLEGWTAKPRRDIDDDAAFSDCWCEIVTEGGAAIGLRPDWRKGRLELSGQYPHNPDLYIKSEEYFSISCATKRGGQAIAKDIERRLLPGYLPKLEEITERDRADKEYKNDTAGTAAKLAALMNTKPHGHRPEEFSLRLNGSDVWGTGRAYGQKVDLDFHSIPADLAEKLILFLQEQTKEGGKQ